MNKLDIHSLKLIFSALDNEKRLKIIELCSEKELTITQLSRELRLNYSVTVEYSSMLEKASLVIKTRHSDKTVGVRSLIRLNNHGEISRI